MTKTEAISKGHTILIGHRPMTKVGRAKEKVKLLDLWKPLLMPILI